MTRGLHEAYMVFCLRLMARRDQPRCNLHHGCIIFFQAWRGLELVCELHAEDVGTTVILTVN